MVRQMIFNLKSLLYLYKKTLILFLMIPLVFTLTKTYDSFFSVMTLMGATILIALPECDFRDKCNIFLLSTPCTRSKYIAGKFFSMVFCFSAVMILGLVITMVMSKVISYGFIVPSFMTIKLTFAFSMIFLSMYYFINFSFNLKLAKVSYFLAIFIVIFSYAQILPSSNGNALKNVFPNLFNFLSSTSLLNNILFFALIIIVVCIIAVFTITIYEKKDF